MRVFARVFNIGDVDVYGFVIFSINDQEIAEPQPISVKVNTYDDVYIDWLVAEGSYDIEAKIVATNPQDESSINDLAVKENFFVDLDTDGDGIGDSQDLDNDNDQLSDERELVLGTDPLNPDSDGDKVQDAQDAFPLDKTEWQDTDLDGLGDNLDPDDDNDGLADEEELVVFNTDPLKSDTDGDLIPDKTELEFGGDLLQPNRNEWQALNLGLASIGSAVKSEAENNNLLIGQLFAAFGVLSIIWLILNFWQRKKRQK